MARLPSPVVSICLLCWVAFTGGAATPAAGQQTSQALQEWTLQNVRASWCVHFLMDSAAADKELPRGFRPVRAADFPELSPAVKYLIDGEPEYQNWVPAEWCSFYFDQTRVGDQALGSASPELKDTQYLGAWLIGALPTQEIGSPQKQSFFMATLRTPNWRFIRLAETSLIRVEYAEPAIGTVPEGTDDRHLVEMGRTIITWDGHVAGDSASVAAPIEQIWWGLNTRSARISAQVRLAPEKRQNVAGTLQIAGNDHLAKSLRASPIRMVGPYLWGGSATLSFSR